MIISLMLSEYDFQKLIELSDEKVQCPICIYYIKYDWVEQPHEILLRWQKKDIW